MTMSSAAGTRPSLSPSGSRTTLIRRLADILLHWHARSRGRHTLLGLDDRMLRDVGLTRVDAYREAMKPFWRA
jgi:uncharacterized protein YjiS (DUF1127 family)